jgi:hypothetical protein
MQSKLKHISTLVFVRESSKVTAEELKILDTYSYAVHIQLASTVVASEWGWMMDGAASGGWVTYMHHKFVFG